MNNTPVIGVDLDDVLWDLLEAWLQRYNDVTNDNVSPNDIESWDIAQYIHNGSREILFYVLEQEDFWETVKAKIGSQFYLKQLMDDGYDVVIVTASSYQTLKPKMEQFFKLFPYVKNNKL